MALPEAATELLQVFFDNGFDPNIRHPYLDDTYNLKLQLDFLTQLALLKSSCYDPKILDAPCLQVYFLIYRYWSDKVKELIQNVENLPEQPKEILIEYACPIYDESLFKKPVLAHFNRFIGKKNIRELLEIENSNQVHCQCFDDAIIYQKFPMLSVN